jgi:hypothetical protein
LSESETHQVVLDERVSRWVSLALNPSYVLRSRKEKKPGTKPGVSFVGRADVTFQRGTLLQRPLATWEDATSFRDSM